MKRSAHGLAADARAVCDTRTASIYGDVVRDVVAKQHDPSAADDAFPPQFKAKHRHDNPMYGLRIAAFVDGRLAFKGHADADEWDWISTPGPAALQLAGCASAELAGKKIIAVENHLFEDGRPVRPPISRTLDGADEVGPVCFLSGGGQVWAVGEGRRPAPLVASWCADRGPSFPAGEPIGTAVSEPAF